MANKQPVIEKVIEELPTDGNAIVVVPSHRFKLFLASELSAQGKKIPYMFQLPELIDQISKDVLLAENPFVIQVALYKFLEDQGLWNTEGESLPLFRRFALIGQIIKDFEELLLNLPLNESPSQVVRNIQDYYRTGTEFVDDEQRKHYLEILRDIWHVDQMTTVPHKQALEFIAKLWELSGKFFLEKGIYDYTQKIWRVPVVTEGILLRKALEDKLFIQELNSKFNNPKVIVAGFGPLDILYYEIFKHLKDNLKESMVVIWEGGEWLEKLNNYILQPFLETQSKINKKYEKYSLIWQINQLNAYEVSYPLDQGNNNVEIHIVPNRTSQVGLLAKMIPSEHNGSDKFSLILLLQKDLGSHLWHAFEKINLSMGLPLALTPLKSFLSLLDELLYFINDKNDTGDISPIPIALFVKWQDHPIGKFLVNQTQDDDQQPIDPSKTIFVTKSVWAQKVIDFLTSHGTETISSILKLLQYLDEQLSTDEKQNISRASVQQIAIIIHYLQPILKQLEDLNARQIIQLLRSMLFSQQVTLRGEPLYGLQAMEILETRGLSFDEVFIPDVSETTLPSPEQRLSMIPVSIRLFFGLPSSEIHSFRNYYYLYRLLASTKGKIHFITPSNMDGQPTQKSIILSQIPIMFPNKEINTTVYVHSTSLKPSEPDLSFVESLIESPQEETVPLTLSVTELVSLLKCPRKFLLSRFLPEEIEEPYDLLGTDNRLIGNLVHNCLAKIYENGVDPETLKALINNDDELTKVLNQVLWELLGGTTENSIATDFHLIPSFNISKQYVKKIIERDYSLLTNPDNDAIKNISHEQEIYYKDDSRAFVIKGRIDRLEHRSSTIRIVDFKHGVSSKSSSNEKTLSVSVGVLDHIEEIIKSLKSEGTNEEAKLRKINSNEGYALQILIYKNLYAKQSNDTDKTSVVPYIYSISNVMSPQMKGFELKVQISTRNAKNEYKSLSPEEIEQVLMDIVFKLSTSVSELLRQPSASVESLITQFFPIESDQCQHCRFKNICFIHKEDG
ncbi:MAG: hypothetical protein GXO48_00980 [Chlorobi bacterium]|nr:hypothetical protein [Chlorobiota bacterium]